MKTELQEYHYIWLSNHPNRDEEWLRLKLKEGFDIHHIDGNHFNNEPSNLVLIECQDHLCLHQGKLNRIQQIKSNGPKKTGLSLKNTEDCLFVFKMREDGLSWQDIKRKTGLTISKAKLMCSRAVVNKELESIESIDTTKVMTIEDWDHYMKIKYRL